METSYYLGFSVFPGIGPALMKKLLKEFGSPQKAWEAPEKALLKVLGERLTGEFVDFRESFSFDDFQRELQDKKIQTVSWDSKKYPALLKKTKDAPFILYVKGEIAVLSNQKIIAIVGTRKITDYGKEVTQMITRDLVLADFTIVSGLALGVDVVAHTTTLVNSGKTIAVLGCGVDMCYPRENEKVYEEIVQKGGAVVSSFLPGQLASPGTFPARNKIVAGLSLGVVVTEGAKDSGSLITAGLAKSYARPVFSVPGPITSTLSKGTNALLTNGGIPVTSAQDIFDKLGIMDDQKAVRKQKIIKGETKEETQLLHFLQTGPLHFDEIVRKMDKDSKTIGSLLSLMELKGMLKIIGDKYSL